MAIANKKTTVEVTLVLTHEEAETLVDILAFVGGSQTDSRREHAVNIARALSNINYRYDVCDDITGSITFQSKPLAKEVK